MSPISTVAIIAVILFGEIPSVLQWLGVVVVLAAVAYQNGLLQTLMRKLGLGKPVYKPYRLSEASFMKIV